MRSIALKLQQFSPRATSWPERKPARSDLSTSLTLAAMSPELQRGSPAGLAPDGGRHFERRPDGSWTPFTSVPIVDVDGTRMIDFSADRKTLYMLDSRERDKAAFFAVEMATRKATLLAADDEADLVEVSFGGELVPGLSG